MEEKKEIEAEKWDVKVEHKFNRPWENTTADEQPMGPFKLPTHPDISGSFTDTEEETTRFDAKELHINVTQPGYSASALITAFGMGALAGVVLLAILWTHLPVG